MVVLVKTPLPHNLTVVLGATAVITLRLLAIAKNWSLPRAR